MRRLLIRKKAAPAVAAALALLSQTLVAVPVAGRMALERVRDLARTHAEHNVADGIAGMHAGMAGGHHEPANTERRDKPAHSKSEHQSCPFCATATLFGLEIHAQAALVPPVIAETAVARLALVLAAHFDHSHLSRAPPALL
jgi:hypothetical protein